MDKQDETTNQKSQQDTINKVIYIYQNLFVSSVVSIVELVKTVSTENNDKIPADRQTVHTNMRKTCDDIINQYKTQTNDIDQVKVIKKSFKVLTQYKDLVKNHDDSLFTVRTPENKIMTVIPGLNINLVLNFLSEEQKTTLWENIEAMFVSSVKMVYVMTEESRHNKDILDIVTQFEHNTLKKLQNNFFLGLNPTSGDTNQVSMDQLMSSDIVIPGTDAKGGMLGNLANLGVDKLMNPENLASEIKKFTDDDVSETINTLTSMLGNDSDIKEVCTTMVKSVLDDIKTNGIENMFTIAERVSSKLGNKLDPEKMAKTANGMNDLIKNNTDKLKDLKDENGKPIGDDFMKTFQNTLNLGKLFNK